MFGAQWLIESTKDNNNKNNEGEKVFAEVEMVDKDAEIARLNRAIVDLQGDVRYRLERNTVRESIISLSNTLLGVYDPSDWDNEQATAVNEALEELGLPTVTREFEVEVKVYFTQTITITVEAGSLDEVTERIENNELDDELLSEVDRYSIEIESYEVEEA